MKESENHVQKVSGSAKNQRTPRGLPVAYKSQGQEDVQGIGEVRVLCAAVRKGGKRKQIGLRSNLRKSLTTFEVGGKTGSPIKTSAAQSLKTKLRKSSTRNTKNKRHTGRQRTLASIENWGVTAACSSGFNTVIGRAQQKKKEEKKNRNDLGKEAPEKNKSTKKREVGSETASKGPCGRLGRLREKRAGFGEEIVEWARCSCGNYRSSWPTLNRAVGGINQRRFTLGAKARKEADMAKKDRFGKRVWGAASRYELNGTGKQFCKRF